MPKRPVPRLGLMPQVNGSLKLQQDGGFAIAPVIAGATAAYEFAKKVKPATKLKGVLDGATEFKKKHPKLASVFGKVLSAGQSIGLGAEGMPVVVVTRKARKPRKKQAGGAKKRVTKKK
jgi:hypothetical protein